MKYKIEVSDVEIPDRPKSFRAVIRDESKSESDITKITVMSVVSETPFNAICNAAAAVAQRENSAEALSR